MKTEAVEADSGGPAVVPSAVILSGLDTAELNLMEQPLSGLGLSCRPWPAGGSASFTWKSLPGDEEEVRLIAQKHHSDEEQGVYSHQRTSFHVYVLSTHPWRSDVASRANLAATDPDQTLQVEK